MNMLRVVLVLTVAVACVHAGIQATCSNSPYDSCTTMCCNNNVGTVAVPVPVPSDGIIPSCSCNDTSAATFQCSIGSTVTNISCCSPLAHGGSYNTDTTKSRSCYDSTRFGCCIIQRLIRSSTNTVIAQFDSNVYDTATQDCCSPSASQPVIVYDGDNWKGIVNKGDSCATNIAINNIATATESGSRSKRARCRTTSDCPSSKQTCCIRPRLANEASDLDQYVTNADTGLGECIDPTTTSCCNGGTGRQVGNGTTSNLYQFLDHLSYDSTYQACCVDGSVINIRVEKCPCAIDSDCTKSIGTGSTCCTQDSTDYTIAKALTCASTCSNMGDPIVGCYGKCTRPQTYDGSTESCVRCGDATKFDTTGNLQCCQPLVPATISSQLVNTTYNSETSLCCKRGAVGSGSLDSVVGNVLTETGKSFSISGRCACASDAECPNSMKCCAQPSGLTAISNSYYATGTCYDPQLEGCCASESSHSNIYTLTTDVCCPTIGIQTNSGLKSCPCNSNNQCPNSGTCCMNSQFDSFAPQACSTTDQSGCNGYCIDSQFQTCCASKYTSTTNVCNSKYQTCCDDGNCVNKHAKERCKKSDLSPADYGVVTSHLDQYTSTKGKKWTQIEAPTVSINFYAWGFPTLLSIIGIAILVIGMTMGTRGGVSLLVVLVLVLSAITSVLGILLLWAPTWKYGMFTIITNCAILCSIKEGPWQRRMVVVLAVLLMLYLVDPIASNSILTLDGSFTSANSGVWSFRGLQDLTMQMSQVDQSIDVPNTYQYNNPTNNPNTFSLCTSFYNYFQRDPSLYDMRTFNFYRNPTHGICRHDWVFAISVFSGLLIALEFLVVVFGSIVLMSGR